MIAQISIDGRPMPLSKDRYLIGRGDGCDILLPEADMGVSRRHAMIERNAQGEWQLLDISSRNGTLVNNQRLSERSTLQDGDVIRIGSSTLTLALPRSQPTVFVPAPVAFPENPSQSPALPDRADGLLGPSSTPPLPTPVTGVAAGAMAYDTSAPEETIVAAAYREAFEPAAASVRETDAPPLSTAPVAAVPLVSMPLPAEQPAASQPSARPVYMPELEAAPKRVRTVLTPLDSHAPLPVPIYTAAPSPQPTSPPLYASAQPILVNADTPIAGFGLRFCAYLIDALIAIPLHFLAAIPWVGIVFAPLVCLYWLSRDAFFGGQSVGKKVMGLRVVRLDGQPFTWGHSVLRNFMAFILFFELLPFIGILAALAMIPLTLLDVLVVLCTGRRIGDNFANTRVIVSP